jgi:O-antigen ligase
MRAGGAHRLRPQRLGIHKGRSLAAPPKARESSAAVTAGGLALCAGLLVVFSLAPAHLHGLSAASYAWRLGMVLLILASWVRSGVKFDARVLAWFLPWLVALALLGVLHFNVVSVWAVVLKNTVLITVGAAIAASAKEDPALLVTKMFLQAVLYGSLALCLFSAANLVVGGWSWELARLAKGESAESGGLFFNTVLFVAAMGMVALLPRGKPLRLAILLIFIGSSIVLATRTPLAALLLALILATGLRWLRSAGRLDKAAVLLMSAIVISVPLFVMWRVTVHPDPDIAQALAGRAQLWQAGLLQWQTSPFVGEPTITYHRSLDLAYWSLNFWEDWRFEALYNLESGGFHSVWVQNLANFGLIGFVGVFLSYCRLFVAALLPTRFLFLVLVILILSRSFFEYSGLFAQANSPLDMVALAALVHAFYKPSPRRRRRGAAPTVPLRYKSAAKAVRA